LQVNQLFETDSIEAGGCEVPTSELLPLYLTKTCLLHKDAPPVQDAEYQDWVLNGESWTGERLREFAMDTLRACRGTYKEAWDSEIIVKGGEGGDSPFQSSDTIIDVLRRVMRTVHFQHSMQRLVYNKNERDKAAAKRAATAAGQGGISTTAETPATICTTSSVLDWINQKGDQAKHTWMEAVLSEFPWFNPAEDDCGMQHMEIPEYFEGFKFFISFASCSFPRDARGEEGLAAVVRQMAEALAVLTAKVDGVDNRVRAVHGEVAAQAGRFERLERQLARVGEARHPPGLLPLTPPVANGERLFSASSVGGAMERGELSHNSFTRSSSPPIHGYNDLVVPLSGTRKSRRRKDAGATTTTVHACVHPVSDWTTTSPPLGRLREPHLVGAVPAHIDAQSTGDRHPMGATPPLDDDRDIGLDIAEDRSPPPAPPPTARAVTAPPKVSPRSANYSADHYSPSLKFPLAGLGPPHIDEVSIASSFPAR